MSTITSIPLSVERRPEETQTLPPPLRLTGPFSKEKLASLQAGDRVLLTGTIYTARDAAHRRMVECLDRGETLPFPLKDALIYYAGPTPAKGGRPIGSVGPTTSYRMDAYTPRLLALGQAGMIGKGPRSKEVKEAICSAKAVYFAAVGGAGALISQAVRQADIVAYEDLGPEAVRRLLVADMPLIVAIDSQGRDLYEK